MSFELDNSNPENALTLQTPSDFGYNDWLDGFYDLITNIELPPLKDTYAIERIDDIAIAVKYIIAYLVEFELNKPQEGGVDKAFS